MSFVVVGCTCAFSDKLSTNSCIPTGDVVMRVRVSHIKGTIPFLLFFDSSRWLSFRKKFLVTWVYETCDRRGLKNGKMRCL